MFSFSMVRLIADVAVFPAWVVAFIPICRCKVYSPPNPALGDHGTFTRMSMSEGAPTNPLKQLGPLERRMVFVFLFVRVDAPF